MYVVMMIDNPSDWQGICAKAASGSIPPEPEVWPLPRLATAGVPA